MTEEEIKQKAEAEADKVIIGKGMDRASVIHLKYLLVTMYVQGANLILSQLTEKDKQIAELNKKLDFFMTETVAGKEYRPKEEVEELEAQIEKMKVCSNCKHFNNLDDLEYCQNCERQLVNSLDKLPREEIIKDEWQFKE